MMDAIDEKAISMIEELVHNGIKLDDQNETHGETALHITARMSRYAYRSGIWDSACDRCENDFSRTPHPNECVNDALGPAWLSVHCCFVSAELRWCRH